VESLLIWDVVGWLLGVNFSSSFRMGQNWRKYLPEIAYENVVNEGQVTGFSYITLV
jgi:hypothetical protein